MINFVRAYGSQIFLGGLALLIMFLIWDMSYTAGAAGVQQKWDKAISTATAKENAALLKAQADTEQYRKVLIDYVAGSKAETDRLERAVATGGKRVFVRATCPVQPASGVPIGVGSGTAELTAAARQDYFDLRRGYAEQLGLLNFCRSELRKRSR